MPSAGQAATGGLIQRPRRGTGSLDGPVPWAGTRKSAARPRRPGSGARCHIRLASLRAVHHGVAALRPSGCAMAASLSDGHWPMSRLPAMRAMNRRSGCPSRCAPKPTRSCGRHIFAGGGSRPDRCWEPSWDVGLVGIFPRQQDAIRLDSESVVFLVATAGDLARGDVPHPGGARTPLAYGRPAESGTGPSQSIR